MLHLLTIKPTLTLLLDADEIDSQFEGIATTLTLNLEGATLELITSIGPSVLPKQRTDGKYTAPTQVEVGLPVE